jgi:DNA polymerase III delta subunit
MPKLELKTVQKELEQGIVWPLYWLYGPEKLKSRELLKRIRKAVFGQEPSEVQGSESYPSWNEETWDGGEADVSAILDSANSLFLGGGVRLIIIRDAHALKNGETLAELCGPPKKVSELISVCVCISKDLDARKKFSKQLIEKAAVVACEEVSEDQREAWIQYLAKRRGLEVPAQAVSQLATLDPWSLDIIEQELEKFSLTQSSSDVLLDNPRAFGGSDGFLESFFLKNLSATLPQVSRFADQVDISLPLLGLLGWNVRQLAVLLSDQVYGTRNSKLNPYQVERFRKWSRYWKLDEVISLQEELISLDFHLKQTPLLPLGLWSDLVMRFCR